MEKLTGDEIKKLPVEKKNVPPEIIHQDEYWPKGRGKEHLDASKRQKRAGDVTTNEYEVDTVNSAAALTAEEPSASDHSDFVKRASNKDVEILEPGDDDYPFPYSIDTMVKNYGGINW